MVHRFDVFPASPAARAPAPAAGPTIAGKWQLLQHIGQGAWTDVYRGQPVSSGRGPSEADYAIKILRPEYQTDPLAIGFLCREAQVAEQVRHVHLTSVLSANLRTPPYYLVSPFLVGVSLRAALHQVGRLAVAHALWVARQMAEALDALHRFGWRHADVKPENILVGPNGHATLLDLGFAARADGDAAAEAITGSPAYWSPESCSDELPTGPLSDIYSLGVTLFESLAGRCPFVADNAAGMAAAHHGAPVPEIGDFVPHVGPDVARLLRSMLAKRPTDRPSARQLIDRLVELEIDALPERLSA